MIALLRKLLLIFFLALPSLAMAQDAVRQGMDAFRLGDYETARKLLEPYPNNASAAYLLGQMKSQGRGGPVDFPAAARHYMVAVRAGHTGAMLSLGFLHDNGWGVAREGALAQELYIAAAAQGVAMAKNNLAYLWARQDGLLPEALCLSAQTLEEEPENPYYLDTYGFILLQMKQAERAEAYFRKAIKLVPDYVDALEHLGDVMAMTGRAEASAYWRRAASNPRDDRQRARIAAKLGGAPLPGDINAHPAFTLRNPGLPTECGSPSV